MNLCLVIPCYNEESRLNISEISKHAVSNSDQHLLFVNDGSRDATLEVLKLLASSHENISYFDLGLNSGKAEAVRQGMIFAKSLGEFSHIGYWDADLATPFSELENFKRVMKDEKFEIVMGSRILRLGGHVDRKWYRHLLGRVFATAASMCLSLPVYDTQCGAKFFKTSIVSELFSKKFISYWIFDVELLFRYITGKRTKSINETVYELPLERWEDVAGSKLSPFDFLKAPLELYKIRKKYQGKKWT
ncbi:hypothetical protein A9Q84_05020 [Halobacteriovorax marinus]|uniref:Glycosyltransferase 2-like domain-containing protein n=1 Tax=Halobacteriovorax marinus TaxID=97084 RepID=A0A1Y5FAZ2_9BACT|nr:hypothetical protein A9Q84_05020 [Halobacteriovorax marinus]